MDIFNLGASFSNWEGQLGHYILFLVLVWLYGSLPVHNLFFSSSFSLFLERWEGFFVSFRSFDLFVILEGGIRKGEGGLFSFSQALHTRYLLR